MKSTTFATTAALLTALLSGCGPTTESTSSKTYTSSTFRPVKDMIPAIEITKLAAQKVLEAAPAPDSVLRIDITGNPADGYTYKMDFDTAERNDDLKMFQHNVNLVVSRSILYLCEGTTIDWETSGNGSGFRFRNPNAAN